MCPVRSLQSFLVRRNSGHNGRLQLERNEKPQNAGAMKVLSRGYSLNQVPTKKALCLYGGRRNRGNASPDPEGECNPSPIRRARMLDLGIEAAPASLNEPLNTMDLEHIPENFAADEDNLTRKARQHDGRPSQQPEPERRSRTPSDRIWMEERRRWHALRSAMQKMPSRTVSWTRSQLQMTQ